MLKNIIALYIRLSMEDLDLDEIKQMSISVQNQIAHLHNYLMEHPDIEGEEVREFIDDGYTGTNMNRPALKEMLELVKKGRISCILVKDFSRFGRNYLEVGIYLEQIFPCLGVRFISVNDHYDSGESKGDVPGLEIVFKNIIHDYYSKELSAKVIQTKRNNAKKGCFMGAIPSFGYVKDPENKHKLIIDPESAKTVRKIFQYALEHNSYAYIASVLNSENVETPGMRLRRLGIVKSNTNEQAEKIAKWTPDAVRAILKNPVVTGSVVNHRVERTSLGIPNLKKVKKEDRIIVENMHEPIITKEEFEQVQAIYARRNQSYFVKHASGKIYPLRGLMVCGCCGKKMTRNNKKNPVYLCQYDAVHEALKTGGVEIEEKTILETIEGMILAATVIGHETKQKSEKPKEKQTSKKCIKQNLAQIYEAYASGAISKETFMQRKKEIQILNAEEKNVGAGEEEKQHAEGFKEEDAGTILQKNRKLIMENDSKTWMTNEFLKELIEKIIVFPDKNVQIVWKQKEWNNKEKQL